MCCCKFDLIMSKDIIFHAWLPWNMLVKLAHVPEMNVISLFNGEGLKHEFTKFHTCPLSLNSHICPPLQHYIPSCWHWPQTNYHQRSLIERTLRTQSLILQSGLFNFMAFIATQLFSYSVLHQASPKANIVSDQWPSLFPRVVPPDTWTWKHLFNSKVMGEVCNGGFMTGVWSSDNVTYTLGHYYCILALLCRKENCKS